MVGRQAARALPAVIGLLPAVACALAASASAARAYGPPPGWPDLGAAALQTTDFVAGATVKTQRYVKPSSDSLAEYDREFKEGTVRVNGKRLLAFENDVTIGRTVADADRLVTALPIGIALVAAQIGKEFEKNAGIKPTYTRVGKATGLGVGSNSVGAVIRIGTSSGELRLVIAAMRVQQLDTLFFLMGLPRARIGVPDAKALAHLAATRIQAAMAPHGNVAPAVTGTPGVDQTLTVDNGTWLGFPTTYTYQWDRCDATGANCTPIPGATTSTYVVAVPDVGMTLRADVAAQNAYGSAAAVSSTPTGPVPEPPPPPPPAG